MLLKDLIENVSAEFADTEICGITDDSRKVAPGYAFVCIKGAVADGHTFAQKALDKGAAVIIAEHDLGFKNQIVVPNTHTLYVKMCEKWFGYPTKSLNLIGVTGTNGKTSVTYMLKAILEHCGHKCGLIGTIQNMIGDETFEAKNTTPGVYELQELFSKMKLAGCEYVIMEVSSHALEQGRVDGLWFNAALFTNLTQDHLDYHKTMENYLMAKKKLFFMCDKAIVNSDDSFAQQILSDCNCGKITISTKSDNSTYTAKNISFSPDGLEYEFVGYNTISRVVLAIGGRFSVYNSMLAIATALELGCDILEVAKALSKISGIKGRAEVVPTHKDFTVIIDYAHTPDGLKNILSTFRECKKNRLITVFGCGGDRDKTKRPIMGSIAARLSDYVIVTSDNPRTENPSDIISDIVSGLKGTTTPYDVIENRIEAIKFAIKNAKKDDIIVLAGKGHETYQILGTDVIHLDEREVVKEALEEK